MLTPSVEFTAAHHAMLFASISKAAILQAGREKGEPVIREAVRTYGRQRGGRMALRARRNSHPLTVDTYFAYGEWAVPKGEMDFKLVQRRPHARLNVFKCPWHDIWKKEDALDFGRYFCMEIDAALVRGFNPELEFEVRETRTNGGACCDFLFKDADLTLGRMLGIVYKKKFRPGKSAVMPWEYHAGHLFKTMSDTVKKELPAHSDTILKTALKDFSGYASKRHIRTLEKFSETDFSLLPGS